MARDAIAVDVLSDGRLDLGLGTGYAREEFEAAEFPIRVRESGSTICGTSRPTSSKRRRRSPILIAGNGDRVQKVSATKHADIIGLTGGGVPTAPDEDPLAERIALVRERRGERFADLELNIAITGVPTDSSGVPDLTLTRAYESTASDGSCWFCRRC